MENKNITVEELMEQMKEESEWKQLVPDFDEDAIMVHQSFRLN